MNHIRSISKWLQMVICMMLICSICLQGGIYTLPSHLSACARDLIPRMLIVDPMKRMSIPEIRAHPWFQAHLPRYLAVPPPDTTQQAKKVCGAWRAVNISIVGFDSPCNWSSQEMGVNS